MMEGKKERGGIPLTVELMGPLKPLLPGMIPGVFFGTLAELCGIFVPVMGASLLMYILGKKEFLFAHVSVMEMCMVLVGVAVARGLFFLGEKCCSRRVESQPLLAVQNKMFCGDVILSGAVTILTGLVMVIYIGHCHLLSGFFAMVACLVVGIVIPQLSDRRGAQKKAEARIALDGLKDFTLDSLKGMDEIRQYGQEEIRMQQMNDRSKRLIFLQKSQGSVEGERKSWRNLAVLMLSFCMMFLNMHLYQKGSMDFAPAVLSTVAMIGTFGLFCTE